SGCDRAGGDAGESERVDACGIALERSESQAVAAILGRLDGRAQVAVRPFAQTALHVDLAACAERRAQCGDETVPLVIGEVALQSRDATDLDRHPPRPARCGWWTCVECGGRACDDIRIDADLTRDALQIRERVSARCG